MKAFTFIHAADLHLDAPFQGMAGRIPEEIAASLREASFRAFDNLCDLCREREADFIVLAGDIYDADERSLRAQLRFRDGLKELAEKGIRSFVIHGNHDPLKSGGSLLDWPEGVHTFKDRRSLRADPFEAKGCRVAVSGISFQRPDEQENLASRLKPDPEADFNIALLHGNVGGITGYDNYAPCVLEELRRSGFNYWALGHVHEFKRLTEAGETACVVYPGCLQARSVRETGPKGACVVTVGADRNCHVEFAPLDVIRWAELPVDISGAKTVDAALAGIEEAIFQAGEEADGRGLICRLEMTGRTRLNSKLREAATRDDLLEQIRVKFAKASPFIWVERLEPRTRAEIDFKRQGQRDLLGVALNLAEELKQGLEPLRAQDGPLAELWGNSRIAKCLEKPSEERLREWIDDAAMLLADSVEKEEG